jgi:hypothetical protein
VLLLDLASGTLASEPRRQSTGVTSWDEAKALAAAWEEAQGDSARRYTIQFATEAYLADRQGRNIENSTLRKYCTLVKQLRTFANSKGYVMLDQLNEPSDMDAFYAGWKDGVRAKGKKLERLKGLYEFWVTRKMIVENPAIRPPLEFGHFSETGVDRDSPSANKYLAP